MSKKESPSLTEKIEQLGYDHHTAVLFAQRIGDAPLRDEDDNILIIEDNTVVARLPLYASHG